MTSERLFIAIGGNSLIKSRELQKVEDQQRAIEETVSCLADLIETGRQLVISHGNGPQVGFIMRRSEVARRTVGLHMVPMANCVADTQGAIGYQIQQAMTNEMAARGLAGQCVTIITQVQVAGDDPAFDRPAKPVGEIYDERQIDDIRSEYPHWVLEGDSQRGYRRVVPSPKPIAILETEAIRRMVECGFHVVAAGGGGIPVVSTEKGFQGVAAVVDKDITSALLAGLLGIETLIISTSVERVALHYGTPRQQPIVGMTAKEASNYLSKGHFPLGSMGPKIEAALLFLATGGRKVVITSPESIREALAGKAGTQIVL